jgi:hypothetical protein
LHASDNLPATSTQVERAFSLGRQLLHFTRNRLSPRSIRAFLCLGDWGRRELVDIKDVLEACNTKRRLQDVPEEDEEEEQDEPKSQRRRHS